MELLLSFVGFGVVAFLAAVSPGPDFLVVSRNSLAHSRRIGMYTAAGVGLGVLIHVTYTVVGVGLIISQSIFLFSIVKILGAAYLIFLGSQILLKKSVVPHVSAIPAPDGQKSTFRALQEGFLTNALNLKATIFFVSVFTQFVSPTLPGTLQLLYGVEAATIVGIWFVVLALILTHPAVKNVVGRFQNRVLKVMGSALILLGLRVAFSEQ